MEDKQILLDNINKVHTTEMGINRIIKNLKLNTNDVVEYCKNNNIPLIFFSYKDKELTSEILNERINSDGNYKT